MKKELSNFILLLNLLFLSPILVSAEWVQTGGPKEGCFYTLAVIGNNIFVGTEGAGIFRSSDNGKNWTHIDSGLTDSYINVFAWNSIDNIFIGTKSGIFRSNDNGNSWTEVDLGFEYVWVESILVHDNYVIAGTLRNGVLLSKDNGSSWSKANTGLPDTVTVESFAMINDTIFAGTDDGVYLSGDKGSSWKTINSGFTSHRVFSLAVISKKIFAGTANGIFISANNGNSWNAAYSGIGNRSVWSLAVSGNKIFAGTYGGEIYLSTNDGASWTAVDSGFTGEDRVSLFTTDSLIYAGSTDFIGIWCRTLSDMVGVTKHHLQQEHWSDLHLIISSGNDIYKTITFTNSVSERVNLKIFNLEGDQIATIFDKDIKPGTHSLFWDTKNIANGSYVIKMHTKQNIYSKNIQIYR